MSECTCATEEHCRAHYCAEHGGEPLPCFACGFNASQRVLGAGYRAAKAWKACAKKWKRIVAEVDRECVAAHESELLAKRELSNLRALAVQIAEALDTADSEEPFSRHAPHRGSLLQAARKAGLIK